ncbi:hypothetical protein TrRE_jg1929 [Triparma retinervis]|uniref:Glycosyltransferase n=1 Tax=Triparma retinervis TaxID=2557542 RepID=A0A9W7L5A7_9STRA|nr:hypothetical protein TrRE_jg1929 [Triparma retinervis]
MDSFHFNWVPTPSVFSSEDAAESYDPKWIFQGIKKNALDGVRALPVVSIVTPAHNPDIKLFRETTECLLVQSLTNWEWLVVNDFSTPDSSKEIEEMTKLDSRIVYIDAKEYYQKAIRSNVGRARNLGTQLSTTDFVFFVDSDDIIDPNALEKMLFYLHVHPSAHFVNSHVVGFGAQHYKWRRSVNPSTIFATENVATIMALHRKDSLMKLGGFSDRVEGLEDWDTWLKYANAGMWGGTIPELLVWYRRRETHMDRWNDFGPEGIKSFISSVYERYPKLENNWPEDPNSSGGDTFSLEPIKYAGIAPHRSFASSSKHLLVIFPWLVLGGADRFNLILLKGLKKRGWEITILTTIASDNPWYEFFREVTNDVFILSNLGGSTSFLELTCNIMSARQFDAVMISNSFLGYAMLPYLREAFPQAAFFDYNHMEEEGWRHGGHPRSGVASQPQLDLSFVASVHLKEWMVEKGADEKKIEVAYVGVDLSLWREDTKRRILARKTLGLNAYDKVVLYSCRFVDQKQPLLFAEVVKAVLLQQDRKGESLTYFLLVGSGAMEKDMNKIFATLPRRLQACIIHVGPLPYDKMYDATVASDINFLPSIMEGIPTTFFEAMSVGNVIVGADVGAISELVRNEETGILIQPDKELSRLGKPFAQGSDLFNDKVEEYSSAIVRLSKDRGAFDRMSEAAVSRIQKFSTDVMTDLIDERMRIMIDNVQRARKLDVPNERVLNIALESFRMAAIVDRSGAG